MGENLFQVLFQVALTCLEVNKRKILKCADDGEAMQVLSNYFERVSNRDAPAVLSHTKHTKADSSVGNRHFIPYSSCYLDFHALGASRIRFPLEIHLFN